MRLGVEGLARGKVPLQNNPGRVQKLVETTEEVDTGSLPSAAAQTLHGQVNFMVVFAAGRGLKVAAKLHPLDRAGQGRGGQIPGAFPRDYPEKLHS